jgi:hypothetical protein
VLPPPPPLLLLLLRLKLLLASLEVAWCCRNEPAEVGGEAAEASGEEEEEEEDGEEDWAEDVQTAPGDCSVSARRNAAASPRTRGDVGGDAPLGEEDTAKPRAAIAKIYPLFFLLFFLR